MERTAARVTLGLRRGVEEGVEVVGRLVVACGHEAQ
jgi:hypothetical protein